MAGAFQDVKPRVRDAACQDSAVDGRNDRIVVAGEDQGRLAQLVSSGVRSTRWATCTPWTGATGAILWTLASGGSCLSGAAISEGRAVLGIGLQRIRHAEQ